VASDLKSRLTDAMKDAMRARETVALGAIRMTLAAIKQREIDTRAELDDGAVLAVIDKQVKQRAESESQFRDAGRDALADKEAQEAQVLKAFLPEPLDSNELDALINTAVASEGATGMRDMGKVMATLKPRIQGRADMQAVSAMVKQRLSS